MSHSFRVYLLHILEETTYLLEASNGLDKQDFLESKTLKRSFVRSLEVIGEATKNLPDDFRRGYPDVGWKKMAGMRDKLIHQYFGIDYDVVWDVVVHQVPGLHKRLESLLEDVK